MSIVAKRLDGSRCHLGREVGLGPGHIVLDGDPAPQKGHSPQFSAHVRCGQTAEWIKMSFCTEISLRSGDIVLDGDPAPPSKNGAQQPLLFGPCILWTNGWIDQDATWYGDRPRPRRHCTRLTPLFSWPYYQLSKLCYLTVILHYSHHRNRSSRESCCASLWSPYVIGGHYILPCYYGHPMS